MVYCPPRGWRTSAQRRLDRERLEIAVPRSIATRRRRRSSSWNGYRKFTVTQKSGECGRFYLMPHDRKPLPPYKPGQYLTFNSTSRAATSRWCYSFPTARRARIAIA